METQLDKKLKFEVGEVYTINGTDRWGCVRSKDESTYKFENLYADEEIEGTLDKLPEFRQVQNFEKQNTLFHVSHKRYYVMVRHFATR